MLSSFFCIFNRLLCGVVSVCVVVVISVVCIRCSNIYFASALVAAIFMLLVCVFPPISFSWYVTLALSGFTGFALVAVVFSWGVSDVSSVPACHYSGSFLDFGFEAPLFCESLWLGHMFYAICLRRSGALSARQWC